MPAKKQKFILYSPKLKKAVRLRLEEGLSELIEALRIRSETQVRGTKVPVRRVIDDLYGKVAWRKGRSKAMLLNLEEELAFVKAEVAYLKTETKSNGKE